ncbi:hypothetical protein [Paraferrimonas sedimenticola]|uniref:Uncharacterized protein n=1 Tax=Paraferrimonas sedimenticola TaxID=375674 RepID=A0AA37RWQ5_9GAMM|nr:hypothetical protein [Paraferrimonas sedimenticola]GLP96122.1 hypothetical protein GCM10007895_14280 [Paraferrimonas sedimenticola]
MKKYLPLFLLAPMAQANYSTGMFTDRVDEVRQIIITSNDGKINFNNESDKQALHFKVLSNAAEQETVRITTDRAINEANTISESDVSYAIDREKLNGDTILLRPSDSYEYQLQSFLPFDRDTARAGYYEIVTTISLD